MRIVLLVLLGLFLALSLAGLALPERQENARVQTIRAQPAELHALLEDFESWRSWHPLFAGDHGARLAVEFGERMRGVGAQLRVDFDARSQVLFTVVVSDPEQGVEIEIRSGTQEQDLWRGEGIQAFESIRFAAADGGTDVTWVQTGAKAPLLLQRTLEFLLVRRRISAQLGRALEGLAAAVEGADEPASAGG